MSKSLKDLINNLNESSLSRIFQHVKSDNPFGVVSAYRGDLPIATNKQRHDELKKMVRDKGYGFIEMRGGYNGDQGFVEEYSVFIPMVDKKDLIDIGQHFDQHSVIFKSNDEFVLIGTNENSGIGKVMMNFVKGGKGNISLAKDAIKDFFSSLVKGSQRGKKFVFNVEERQPWSFNQAAYSNRGEMPEWITIIEEDD